MKRLVSILLVSFAYIAHAGTYSIGNAVVLSTTVLTTYAYATASGLSCTYGADASWSASPGATGITSHNEFANVKLRWIVTYTSGTTDSRSGPGSAAVVFSMRGYGYAGGGFMSAGQPGTANAHLTAQVDNWTLGEYSSVGIAPPQQQAGLPQYGDDTVRDYGDAHGDTTAFTYQGGGVWTAYVYQYLDCDAVTTFDLASGFMGIVDVHAKTEMTILPKTVNGFPVP